MTGRAVAGMLASSFSRWSAHNGPRLGAALAFYTLLSLTPLAVFLVAILSAMFGVSAVTQSLEYDAYVFMGPKVGEVVTKLFESAHQPLQGIIAGLSALATLLLSASAVFSELKDAIDTMWNTKSPYTGLRAVIMQRLFSFGLVLFAGFLFLISMLASAALTLFGRFLHEFGRIPPPVLNLANFLLSYLVFVGLFYMIYRFVPDRTLAPKVMVAGAIVTAMLFVIGKTLLGWYLGGVAAKSAYGAAGSLVAIAVWVYYSAQIFLFGAELTYTFSEMGVTALPQPSLESRRDQ